MRREVITGKKQTRVETAVDRAENLPCIPGSSSWLKARGHRGMEHGNIVYRGTPCGSIKLKTVLRTKVWLAGSYRFLPETRFVRQQQITKYDCLPKCFMIHLLRSELCTNLSS